MGPEDCLYAIVPFLYCFGQRESQREKASRYTVSMNMHDANASPPAANSASGGPQPAVTLEHVLRVAELAHLELTADEQTEMLRDLNSILGHVAQLNELDTTDVPAMAQVSEVLVRAADHSPLSFGSALRSDEPRASLDRKTVMAQAPQTDGVYFKVPKVIER